MAMNTIASGLDFLEGLKTRNFQSTFWKKNSIFNEALSSEDDHIKNLRINFSEAISSRFRMSN